MFNQKHRKNVRNVAIIAHVDHGKTTLIDVLLKQTGAYKFKDGETTIMDSNPLEKKRGMTIFSKNASFLYKGVQFNIVDTPGHADFGSEVERILKMVDNKKRRTNGSCKDRRNNRRGKGHENIEIQGS